MLRHAVLLARAASSHLREAVPESSSSSHRPCGGRTDEVADLDLAPPGFAHDRCHDVDDADGGFESPSGSSGEEPPAALDEGGRRFLMRR